MMILSLKQFALMNALKKIINSKTALSYLLVLFCIVEILLVSFFQRRIDIYRLPLILFITSISIAIIFLRLRNLPDNYVASYRLPRWGKYLSVIIFSLLSCYLLSTFVHDFGANRISATDLTISDIIPQIIVLTKRLLSGQQPYSTIHFSGYDLYPTYLPLQWLPYTLADWTYIDYRWIPALFLWIASLFFFIQKRSAENIDKKNDTIRHITIMAFDRLGNTCTKQSL